MLQDPRQRKAEALSEHRTCSPPWCLRRDDPAFLLVSKRPPLPGDEVGEFKFIKTVQIEFFIPHLHHGKLTYVACTRARDQLSISAVEPASEFLDDLKRVR